jgi:hypothetical protein
MPTLAETAQQLTADGLPILLIDTCILLDVIRAPLRKIPGCIQGALDLAEMQAQSRCRIVASSMIENEWRANQQAVVDEFNRYLEAHDKDASAFHEACGLVNVSLSFGKPSYQAAGLVATLRDRAANILKNATHLSPSEETKLRAYERSIARVPPARKGAGPADCTVVEEYLELCRLLQASGFAKKKTFCSSNTRDYQDGHKLHATLASEFGAVGLVFTNALHWAVNELKNP